MYLLWPVGSWEWISSNDGRIITVIKVLNKKLNYNLISILHLLRIKKKNSVHRIADQSESIIIYVYFEDKIKCLTVCSKIKVFRFFSPSGLCSVFISQASGSENPWVLLKTLKGLSYGSVTVARIKFKRTPNSYLRASLNLVDLVYLAVLSTQKAFTVRVTSLLTISPG